jgi:hypothetical protein
MVVVASLLAPSSPQEIPLLILTIMIIMALLLDSFLFYRDCGTRRELFFLPKK